MMKPAAGTAAPEAITPLMKARREVGLRANPVGTPTAETTPVADPSLSDMAVSPYARQAVTRPSRRPRERQSPSPRNARDLHEFIPWTAEPHKGREFGLKSQSFVRPSFALRTPGLPSRAPPSFSVVRNRGILAAFPLTARQ